MNSPEPTYLLNTGPSVALDRSRPRSEANASDVFDRNVRANQGAIFRVAYRLTGDRDEAEDLVQEALIEAYEAYPKFKDGTHFDRWVFRIMRNTFVDSMRRKSKARFHSLDDGTQAEASRRALNMISTISADSEIMARTLDGPIQEALDDLAPEFRLVVILADIEGLSYEEVGDVIGRPIGTVRSRLHRARMILKDRLRAYVRS
jgi:RNA polymerase sigma factor, sigma-70 family